MTLGHTPETKRLQQRLERWELQHLRQLVTHQARRIERLQALNRARVERMARLRHQAWDADARADMFMDFNHQLEEQLDGRRAGLTIDGRLVLVLEGEVHP